MYKNKRVIGGDSVSKDTVMYKIKLYIVSKDTVMYKIKLYIVSKHTVMYKNKIVHCI
jgi:hypothetical protein